MHMINIDITDPKDIAWLDSRPPVSDKMRKKAIKDAKNYSKYLKSEKIICTVQQIWGHTWKENTIINNFPILNKFNPKIINDSKCTIELTSMDDIKTILENIGEINISLDEHKNFYFEIQD